MLMLYTVFILLDYESISEGWVNLVPKRFRPLCVNLVNDVRDGMNKYFRGQAIVATCVGILFCIPVFILAGFEHSIADIFYFAASGIVSLPALGFIWTVILGNTLGGMILPVLGMAGEKKADAK